MRHKFHRYKLLLDEGLYPRTILRRTNNRHNLKHIKHDFNRGGVSDKDVYDLAVKEKRIIITHNINDFRILARKNKSFGVIGITQGIAPEELDKKLNSLLSKSSENSLYGKYTPLNRNKKIEK